MPGYTHVRELPHVFISQIEQLVEAARIYASLINCSSLR